MRTINVREPESGITSALKIRPVHNFAFPGWVVFIPERRNILLFRQNGKWQIIPESISLLYAQAIGTQLIEPFL